MFDVEAAKRDVIAQREKEWRLRYIAEYKREYAAKNKCSLLDAPNPPSIPEPPDLSPRGWFTYTWETGGIVMDIDEYEKLPKYRKNMLYKKRR